jgi:hypothetical protein
MNTITLKSGRELDPVAGIIGIDDRLRTFSGHDEALAPFWDRLEDDEDTNLTAEERREIADLMIDRWKRFAEQGPTI